MINDMIYSQEQRLLHHYEGFSHRQAQIVNFPGVGGGDEKTTDAMHAIQMLPYLSQSGAEPMQNRLGDYGAWKVGIGGEPRFNDCLKYG